MADEPNGPDMQPEGAQAALRSRTFLKGIVYYDNRRASIDCTIRDLSDTGARIAYGAANNMKSAFRLTTNARMNRAAPSWGNGRASHKNRKGACRDETAAEKA
jgi:hypothetical protein